MNTYVFAVDVDYGIDEFWMDTIFANSVKEAIDGFVERQKQEREDDSFNSDGLSEMVDWIVEITPDQKVREWWYHYDHKNPDGSLIPPIEQALYNK